MAEGIGEGFDDFEVVVLFTDEKGDGFAGGLQGGGEFAGLALELETFQGAVGNDHRTGDAVEVAERAEVGDHLGREGHILASRRQADGRGLSDWPAPALWLAHRRKGGENQATGRCRNGLKPGRL